MLNTQEITVLVDSQERSFHLQKFTIKRALEYIEQTENAWNTAREGCLEALGSPAGITLASRAFLEAIRPTVVSLLCHPADGGTPLTDEEFWLLDAGEVQHVLDAQESVGEVKGIVVRGQILKNEALEQEARRLKAQVDQLAKDSEG